MLARIKPMTIDQPIARKGFNPNKIKTNVIINNVMNNFTRQAQDNGAQ